MAHEEKHTGGYGDSPHMRTVAWSILVMGVSLAIVMVLFVWFGHMPGSNFSDEVMREQQEQLRLQYGLPPAPEVSDKDAQIPPSLRGK
jgi:hypothetical protein